MFIFTFDFHGWRLFSDFICVHGVDISIIINIFYNSQYLALLKIEQSHTLTFVCIKLRIKMLSTYLNATSCITINQLQKLT